MQAAKHCNTYSGMVKTTHIPELRFREFEGEWKWMTINNVFTLISGQHLNPDEYTTEKGDLIPYFSGPSDFTNSKTEITKWALIKSKEAIKGDILLTVKGSGLGTMLFLDLQKVAIGRQIMSLRSEKASTVFLFHHLGTQKQYFESLGKGNMIPGLSRNDILDLKVCFPDHKEQQKIATFLTAIDEKLTQLKKKKSLLEQYKKGVMQKIFSQEIRFKDEQGEEFPEWEEKKFGQLYSFITTNSLSREKLNYESGTVKNIHYGDIHTKFNPLFDITTEYVPYINDEIQLAKLKPENYCIKGDLVIADASEDYNDIGKAIEIAIINDEKVVAGLHTILARPNLSKISYAFGAFLMKSDSIHFQIRIISQGAKVLGLSSNKLSNISVILPCLAEQTKIANFLSAIDDKITHCSTQIEKMGLWKKGLLQKMFC